MSFVFRGFERQTDRQTEAEIETEMERNKDKKRFERKAHPQIICCEGARWYD